MFDPIKLEISQIAKTGRILFTSDIGFDFVAELDHVEWRESYGKKYVDRNKRMKNCITVLSKCHGVMFQEDRNGNRKCQKCGQAAPWSNEEWRFSIDEDQDKAIETFSNVVVHWVEGGPVEALILSKALILAIESVWDEIRNGNRISEIVVDFPEIEA